MELRFENHDGVAHLVITGDITEDSDFKPALELASQNLVIDLEGVTRINSCGVREWLNFINALQNASCKLVLQRCSTVIVAQLNTIYNFQGEGTVRSVFGPFYCPGCDQEQDVLIDLEKHPIEIPDNLSCQSCSGQMEFEELHEEFLRFLKGRA